MSLLRGWVFIPFTHREFDWIKKKSGWVSGDSSMLMYDPFHPWEGPDSGHLLQASNCRIFGGAWPCPTRSEHLSCVSLNNGWKEMKWLGYSWVEPEYDRRETAFTHQPSNPSTCVRGEGWHAWALTSLERFKSAVPPFPRDAPVQTGAQVQGVEKEENALMAWPCAQVIPLGRWGLCPVPRGSAALSRQQAGSFLEILLPWHG